MTIGMLALIIVAAFLAQVSAVALVGFYRRKRQYREIDIQASEPQIWSQAVACCVYQHPRTT